MDPDRIWVAPETHSACEVRLDVSTSSTSHTEGRVAGASSGPAAAMRVRSRSRFSIGFSGRRWKSSANRSDGHEPGRPSTRSSGRCESPEARPTLVCSCPLLTACRQVSIPALETRKPACLTARSDWFGKSLVTPDHIGRRPGRAKPKPDPGSIPSPRPLAATVPKSEDPPAAGGTSKRMGRPSPVMDRLAWPARVGIPERQATVRPDPIRRGNRIELSRVQGS